MPPSRTGRLARCSGESTARRFESAHARFASRATRRCAQAMERPSTLAAYACGGISDARTRHSRGRVSTETSTSGFMSAASRASRSPPRTGFEASPDRQWCPYGHHTAEPDDVRVPQADTPMGDPTRDEVRLVRAVDADEPTVRPIGENSGAGARPERDRPVERVPEPAQAIAYV